MSFCLAPPWVVPRRSLAVAVSGLGEFAAREIPDGSADTARLECPGAPLRSRAALAWLGAAGLEAELAALDRLVVADLVAHDLADEVRAHDQHVERGPGAQRALLAEHAEQVDLAALGLLGLLGFEWAPAALAGHAGGGVRRGVLDRQLVDPRASAAGRKARQDRRAHAWERRDDAVTVLVDLVARDLPSVRLDLGVLVVAVLAGEEPVAIRID